MKRIPEEFIHYLWSYGLFPQTALRCINGESIEIEKRGTPNLNSGPDFLDASIRIGRECWMGNVEIHFKSSDWNAHGHQDDPAYNNVILHVVIRHDKEVHLQNGAVLTTLSLSPYLNLDHFRDYERFIQSRDWIPCARQATEIDEVRWAMLRERSSISRLERKSQELLKVLDSLKGNWEETSARVLASAWGAKVNASAFEELLRRTPYHLLLKYGANREQLEALILGQAGFLSQDWTELYPARLVREYELLKGKHGLVPMLANHWKSARIRPASAPQVRLVQFARLFERQRALHSLFIDGEVKSVRTCLQVQIDGYWKNHIALGRSSSPQIKRVGANMVNRLLINCVVLLRYAYGVRMNEARYRDSALSLLKSIPSEDNRIIRSWNKIGVHSENALDSQGLLEWKKIACDEKRCLNCSVGVQLLRKNAKMV